MKKMTKITELTPEQEAKIPLYYEKWYRNGLRVDRLDKERAIHSIEWVYEKFLPNAKKPAVIFGESPIGATLLGAMLREIKDVPSLRSSLRSSLWSSLQSSLRSSLWSSLESSLDSSLRSSLDSSLRSSLWSSLDSSFDSSLWSSLQSSLQSSLRSSLWSSLDSSLDSSLGSSLWSSLRSSLRSSLDSSLDSSLWSSLQSSLDSSLRSSLDSSLWSSLDSSLRSSLRSSLWSSQSPEASWIRAHWNDGYYANWWVGWICFYEFLLNEVFIDKQKEFSLFTEFLTHWKDLHLVYPYDGLCFVVERPREIHLETSGRLHRDITGPALLYGDGYCLWSLNGVQVPNWLVLKKPEELKAEDILKLPNAEQRKEGIRKFGIDRMREPLKVEVIDSWKDYELWTIEFEGRRIGPYLKMVNDSTGQIHVEGVGEITHNGVDKEIKTCKEALAWRGGFEKYEDAKWTA